jgi:hypothetical protein
MTNPEEFNLLPPDVDPDAHLILQTAQYLASAVGSVKSDPLAQLASIYALRTAAQMLTTRVVSDARARGESWESIAEMLDMTRQAAWERYRYLV